MISQSRGRIWTMPSSMIWQGRIWTIQFIRQGYSPSFSNCFLQRGQLALLRKTIIYSKRKLLLGILMFDGVETMRRLTWWPRRGGRGCVLRGEGRSQAGAAVEEEVSSLKELWTGERKKPRRQPRTPFGRWDTELSPPLPWSPATQVSSKNILLRRVDFGIWLFENQILNSTLRRRMFMINTTTSFH